jgi:hypothetical protein
VNVRFDVYGTTAEELDDHAGGILADFGPHHEWTWDIVAEAGPNVAFPAYFVGHVTAWSVVKP